MSQAMGGALALPGFSLCSTTAKVDGVLRLGWVSPFRLHKGGHKSCLSRGQLPVCWGKTQGGAKAAPQNQKVCLWGRSSLEFIV